MSDPNENKSGYKPTKAGWIPTEWNVRRLDDVSSRATGHTPNKTIPEYWNGGRKWVSLSDSDRLDALRINETSKEISDLGIENSSARLLPPGTVILLRDASVGKVAVLGSEMAVSQHFVAWICNGEINNHFLYYWLLSERRLFQRMAVGTTIVTIGMPFFAKLEVPVPPIREQEKIAEILSASDETIQNIGELIKAKQRQKRVIMLQLLTGEKRLAGFDEEWPEVRLEQICSRLRNVAENPEAFPVLSITAGTGFVSQADKFSRVIAGKQVEKYVLLRRGEFSYKKAIPTATHRAAYIS